MLMGTTMGVGDNSWAYKITENYVYKFLEHKLGATLGRPVHVKLFFGFVQTQRSMKKIVAGPRFETETTVSRS